MADSPKLCVYGRFIYFSSQRGFEPEYGGSFQWTSEGSFCHPRAMVLGVPRASCMEKICAGTGISTVKTKTSESEYSNVLFRGKDLENVFSFIYLSFTPEGDHLLQPSKYVCEEFYVLLSLANLHRTLMFSPPSHQNSAGHLVVGALCKCTNTLQRIKSAHKNTD